MEDDEYRKLAAVEDRMWYFEALHALVERALARALAADAAILDAGCGTGGLIRRLGPAHPGWRWTGVDASPMACALARERCAAEIVEGNLLALPLPAARFDAVVCADVLYHVEDDLAALCELRRMLRPGGLLVVNVPAHPWLWSYHDVAVSGLRRYERSGLSRTLTAAGFRPKRLTHWNALLLPLIAARRKLLPPPPGGSDVHAVSAPVNALGRAATVLERAWLRAGSLPFGSSILATAH